ncbi:MAG: branched-chain amino acid ABC transporter permease [Pseudomonadota bacterium]
MDSLLIGQFINGAIIGAIYGILALAISLTFGLTGIVNFALGSFMMVGAYCTWAMCALYNWPYPLAVAAAVALTAVLGWVADLLLFRLTRDHLVNGLLVSIGLVFIMEAAVQMIFTTTPQVLDPVVTGSVSVGAASVPTMRLVVLTLLCGCVGATYGMLNWTRVGRAIRAFAQDREGALVVGIPGARLQRLIFVGSTAIAGLGGALYASLYSIEPAMGAVYVLKAVEGAVLAGIGSTLGVLAAGIGLGTIESVASLHLPLAFRDAYGLLAMILILLFRPMGLFGARR